VGSAQDTGPVQISRGTAEKLFERVTGLGRDKQPKGVERVTRALNKKKTGPTRRRQWPILLGRRGAEMSKVRTPVEEKSTKRGTKARPMRTASRRPRTSGKNPPLGCTKTNGRGSKKRSRPEGKNERQNWGSSRKGKST